MPLVLRASVRTCRRTGGFRDRLFCAAERRVEEKATRADAERTHMIYLDVHGEFPERMTALAENLDETARSGVAARAKYLEAGEDARRYVEEWRTAAAKCGGRSWKGRATGGASVAEMASCGEWLEESEALVISGRIMLATHG